MIRIILSICFIMLSTLFACSSDYDCGYGKKCAKKPYQFNGVCMNSVNQYGVQQFNAPAMNSFGMNNNSSGCNWNSDCPIGFRCDRDYKRCVK